MADRLWSVRLAEKRSVLSARPNVPAPAFNDPTKAPVYLQNGTIYMLPWNGVQACAFTPNQPEPKHCGGER